MHEIHVLTMSRLRLNLTSVVVIPETWSLGRCPRRPCQMSAGGLAFRFRQTFGGLTDEFAGHGSRSTEVIVGEIRIPKPPDTSY
jgi:hypothetical protein